MNAESFIRSVVDFVRAQATDRAGEYRMCPGGHITLYSSCFAAMTLHYLGALEDVAPDDRRAWAEYLKRHQDPESGHFVGPELSEGGLESPLHDRSHLERHLTAHVLPALELLDERPRYPLRAARRLLDPESLAEWLNRRDWRNAWREGNDLLFVGQFLVQLRDVEQRPEAKAALAQYFDWLDAQQDPKTGLWGTDRHCDAHAALFGGYHQLLVYHACGRPVPNAERIIDTALRLQHPDGGFSPRPGGGACEDVDAIDVLVNLERRTGHRPRATRRALRAALGSVLKRQRPDGGFVYRSGEAFVHMGMSRTTSPADTSNLFATWFGVHAIALACQLVEDHSLARIAWRFNRSCSMGWHDASVRVEPRSDPLCDRLPEPWHDAMRRARNLRHGAAARFGRRALAAARRPPVPERVGR